MKNAILKIIDEGGLTLWALLVLAVLIYSMIFMIWWRGIKARQLVAQRTWTKGGMVKGNLPWNQAGPSRSEMQRKYATFELDEMAWVERRLPFLGVLIGAAPLLGLLGTVAGMLMTFAGMASGGNAAPIDTISAGISKALVTTQAGLVVAVPAAFLFALLKRQTESTHFELQRQLHEELQQA